MLTPDDTADDLLNAVRTIEPLIRQHADEAESNHRLSRPVVDATLFPYTTLFRSDRKSVV